MLLLRVIVGARLVLLVLGTRLFDLDRRQDPATPTEQPTSVSTPPEVAFTLISSNPTAYPLGEIVATPSTHTTQPLGSTYSVGQQPTAAGPLAPPLPAVSSLAISSYPQLDRVPPIDSPEVQQWIQLVMDSGVAIPNIPPTVVGGCETNQDRIGNSSICWWTCGQCTRETDITTCPEKLTWGLSFDDGPSPDTPRLLDYLASQNLQTTFFVVGSRAISRQDILQAEHMQGHQLSVHTWSHPALTTLTNEEIIAELGWTAKVIKEVTGVTPNTFRPPYGDIDDRVRAIGRAMGMTSIIWTAASNNVDNFDTNDWHIGAGTVSASGVIAAFEDILRDASNLDTGFIVLAHDLYQQSVDLAVGYILPDALARTNPNFNLMSIIECLGHPLANAYIETNNNVTNPPPVGTSQSGNSLGASSTSAITSMDQNSANGLTLRAGEVKLGLVVIMALAALL